MTGRDLSRLDDRQYHVRRIDGVLWAWNVRRLVGLTEGLDPTLVPLEEIAEIDEPYWAEEGPPMTGRAVLDHLRIMREADLAWPIILCPERRLMDGMHRVLKALDLGHEKIAAYVLPEMPEPDHKGVPLSDLP